jgi:peroxiredoxin
LRRNYEEIQARSGTVLAVSFEPRDRLFQLSRQLRLPFPLLSDPEQDVYRAYGLKRGRLSQLVSPGTVLAYLKLLARGRIYHFRWSDLRQLGGDFVIDGRGIVQFEHRSAAPHYRPSVERLLAMLDSI